MLIETNLLTQIEALKQEGKAFTLYAIADPAQEIKLRTQYLPKAKFENQSSLLDPSDTSDEAATVAPFLVQLPSPSDDAELWKNLIGFAQKNPAALTVLASMHPFTKLHKHLSYFTEIRLPDETAMVLAYWDPAILGTLLGNKKDETLHVAGPVFSPQQMQAFLAPIVAWWYWDRSGQLQRINGAGADVSVESSESMRLDQKQVDSLVEASVPDHVLAYLKETQPALLDRLAPKEQYPTARRLLVEAHALHLDAMQEQVRFVGVSLIYGKQMKEDETILKLLEKVQQRKLKIGDALQQFPAPIKGKP